MKQLKNEKNNLQDALSHVSARYFAESLDQSVIEDVILGDWGDVIESLENLAVLIEADHDNKETLASIKYILQSLKGESRSLGIDDVSDIFDRVEILLDDYLDQDISPTDILLMMSDWLKNCLYQIAEKNFKANNAGTALLADARMEAPGTALPADARMETPDDAAPPDVRMESPGETAPAESPEKRPLKILVVDDDFTNRMILQEGLKIYGLTHVAVNGQEAVTAFLGALKTDEPYDLICLDIMMPVMDGQEALKLIRQGEEQAGIFIGKGVKVIMITALDDGKNVMASFREQCDAYIVKPITKAKLRENLLKLSLI